VISDVEELPDGRYNLVLSGLVKFRILGEDRSQAYRLAQVEALPEVVEASQREALRQQRERLESLLASIAPQVGPFSSQLPDDALIDGLSQYLDIHPIERQELLEEEGPLSRAQALIELLEKKTQL
jgi:Lon protease-like protein